MEPLMAYSSAAENAAKNSARHQIYNNKIWTFFSQFRDQFLYFKFKIKTANEYNILNK